MDSCSHSTVINKEVFSYCSPIASTMESGAGQLPGKKCGEQTLPSILHVVQVSAAHDKSV